MQTKGLSQQDTAVGMAYEQRIIAAVAMYEEAVRARDLYIDSLRVRYESPAAGGWGLTDWSVGFAQEEVSSGE